MPVNPERSGASPIGRVLRFSQKKQKQRQVARRAQVQLVESVGYDTVRLVGSLEGSATVRIEVVLRTDDFSGEWIRLLERFVETGSIPVLEA